MTTATDFARAAAQMGRAAEQMKPPDNDLYGQQRKLIQFHLISAARLAREIAEALAKQEEPTV